jgi:hypothetical protein
VLQLDFQSFHLISQTLDQAEGFLKISVRQSREIHDLCLQIRQTFLVAVGSLVQKENLPDEIKYLLQHSSLFPPGLATWQ